MVVQKIQDKIRNPRDVPRYIISNPPFPYLEIGFGILSRYPIGTNIFSRDWDLLVILDACRVDALEAVAPEYPFLHNKLDTLRSRGSSTIEWVPQTFTNPFFEEIKDTVCVTASPWIERILSGETSPEEFYEAQLTSTDWDIVSPDSFLDLQTILPSGDKYHRHVYTKLRADTITARAITAKRELDPPRLLVHYLHPHKPYIEVAANENRELYQYEEDPWQYLREGGDLQTVWESYLNELRAGLNSITRLLRNADADTAVITSDHGETFGQYLMEHPPCNFHPKLRNVPWVETTANDTKEWIPDVDLSKSNRDMKINEQLEALGYM